MILNNDSSKIVCRQTSPVYAFIMFLLISTSLLTAAPDIGSEDLAELGAMAYVSSENGKDAIFIREGDRKMSVYVCSSENEIILTPKVTVDGQYISFLVDDGTNHRVIHLLGPLENHEGFWTAVDSTIIVVEGGAWPNYGKNGSIYLSMPAHDMTDLSLATDIYQLLDGNFTPINENKGQERHLWPLISPDGQQIHYRKISNQYAGMNASPSVSSIIYDLGSQTREVHLTDQNIFIEQWAANGMMLYSYRVDDPPGMRVYSLYDPKSRESKEIYQHSSHQARLSPDGRFLATLRTFPVGSPQFDIFVVDLQTQQEINLTGTPHQSESLIDWIK